MRSTRSSKRLAKEGVDGGEKPVRARKPNANSLAAFADKTTPINASKAFKKSSVAKRKRANTVKSIAVVEEPKPGSEVKPSELSESADQDPQDQLHSKYQQAL